MVMSLLVLPALIVIFSRWIGPRAPVSDATGSRRTIWERAPRFAMNRPYTTIGVCLAVCGLLAVPALRMDTVTPDSSILPSSSPSAVGYEAMRTQFGTGAVAPVNVVVTFGGAGGRGIEPRQPERIRDRDR